ncbi:MAG: HPr family phosphocarrier protein [Spirochaetes bacterium]|uniref:HPr family phosphocarrier protein n=1 Tax=Candidatus Ornithospirochaeta stercoravium TaxID=2840897 RepID=A0A9D9IC35_9SPIO|nr:HPr family phosphocarrier protein [Candidatus Ornithospirochaeta stercoravium]
MKTFDYTVKDELGIHARPAGLLVKQIAGIKSNVTIAVKAKNKSADAKRLMAVMKMAVKQGDVVTVTIEGEDEDTAAPQIEQFFKENF